MRTWEKHWQDLSSQILALKNPQEKISLSLNGEDSLFLRFNNSKLRQATDVSQFVLELGLQKEKRQAKISITLTGELNLDLARGQSLLERARLEIQSLPEDPFLVEYKNNGESHSDQSSKLPSATEVISQVIESHQGIDFSGFYSGGPLYRASRNSEGQNHWFVSDSFFYDYSLFTINQDGANKAIKGCYSETQWNPKNLREELRSQNFLLEKLRGPNIKLKPGSYRAYLAPGAVSEIAQTLSWGALSLGAYKQGRSPLAKLADRQEKLSKLISFGENFALGLSPRFNSFGELAPQNLSLVKDGLLDQFLVSSKSAQEYGVESNAADNSLWSSESIRSLEIQTGDLPEKQALLSLDTGVYLSNLHYLNWSDIPNARVTGMTRYACFWVEKGEIQAPIEDMRFDESIYRVMGSELEAITQESILEPNISTYEMRGLGGRKVPGFLLRDFRFTL